MLAGRSRPRRRSPFLLLLVGIQVFCQACASGEATLGVTTVVYPGDLPSAVNVALGAAPACGLRLTEGRRDETKGSAILVFLDEWQDPKPESSLVTVRFEPEPGGVSCRIEAHPLAEYGMTPPDVTAGSEGFVCKPCSQVSSASPLVRYSRGQAMANAARTSRCLGSAIRPAAPNGL
jgi:hypothetical protein